MSTPERDGLRTRRRGILVVVATFAALVIFAIGFKAIWDARVRDAASQSKELYTPKPADEPTTVLFLGDALISGAGATDTSKRLSTQIANKYGWVELNEARGGIGYLAQSNGCGTENCPNLVELVDELKGYQPDIIFISAGRVDPYQGENSLASNIQQFYQKLSENFADSRIFVVLPFLNLEEDTPEFQAFKGNVRYWAGNYGAKVFDLGQPLFNRADLLSADGYQPNDLGYAELAKAFFKAYRGQ